MRRGAQSSHQAGQKSVGEKERAVALLKEAFSQGLDYGVYLHRDIDLEPLWDYQPFKELLRPKG